VTCIVGLKHKNKVYIGGDSAGVSGLDITLRKDPKVFKNGQFIYGFTSSFRMGQLIQTFKAPPITSKDKEDIYKYMTTKFINKLRKHFKDGGYTRVDANRESGGFFLIGHKNRLFSIDADFQVGESYTPYSALGCGADYALGVLYALRENDDSKNNPNYLITRALEAAEFFSGGVRAPFNIVNT
jgi:ATP-dependent protease HslVU (ClpYQ) peptidase subunit